ncbi:hypothetical protein GIB67_016486, partial [Kingdonia uniflora]
QIHWFPKSNKDSTLVSSYYKYPNKLVLIVITNKQTKITILRCFLPYYSQLKRA